MRRAMRRCACAGLRALLHLVDGDLGEGLEAAPAAMAVPGTPAPT